MSIPERALPEAITELVERVRLIRSLPSPVRCKRIRERAGVSRRRLAAAMEVDVMTLCRWEEGLSTPRPEHAARYRQALDALEQAVQS